MNTDIAIIGGGLSGLALADQLHSAGYDFQLFEARDRLGGRVLSQDLHGLAVDLGPSWFWPGQTRIEKLIKRLGLSKFDQYSHGATMFEAESGQVLKDMGYASMQGSWRLRGGIQALINALGAQLPSERIHLGKELKTVSRDQGLSFSDGSRCTANHVVLALPPRIAAALNFEPELSSNQLVAMQAVPTWMAAHAKFFAVYDHAFWREAGLSGDAMSRRGPLAEIHDASAEQGSPAALFGFVGVPAAHRSGHEAQVKAAAVEQLTRIFGPKAAEPKALVLQDWTNQPFTSTTADQMPLGHHPAYGMPDVLTTLWDGKLKLCATETAPDCGGFLEGALASAQACFRQLNRE